MHYLDECKKRPQEKETTPIKKAHTGWRFFSIRNISNPKKREERLAVLLLLVAAIAVYLNAVYGEFLLDDEILVQKNPTIQSLWQVDLLTYRWVRTFSYALDHVVWGTNPVGYHLSNILYHTLTVLVVFLLTRKLTGAFLAAFISAMIFAIHPVHTEAVTYISGRRDILSALFYLLGFYTYLKARDTQAYWLYFLVIVLYFLGISSKEMAVTLPLCIFAYEVLLATWERRDSGHRVLPMLARAFWINVKKFRLAIVTVCLLLASYLYMVLFLQHGSGMVTAERFSWWGGTPVSNFATVTCILNSYLKMLFFPIILQVDYILYPFYASFSHPKVLAGSLVILTLLGLSVVMTRRHWRVSFLIWFFFITLMPVMHFIPHHIIMAEHYLYLPSFAFCLGFGMLVQHLMEQKNLQIVTAVVLVLFAGSLFVRTVDRNADWVDVIKLLNKGLKHDAKNPVYHFFLGRAYHQRGMHISASEQLAQAVSPRYNHYMIHATRASIAYQKGNYEEGEKHTEEALRLEPQDPLALVNRGLFALLVGDTDKALGSYLLVPPDYEKSEHLQNLALIYLTKREIDKAEGVLLKALELHPERGVFHYGMAEVQVRKLDFMRAEKEYGEALRLAESDPELKKRSNIVRKKIAWTRKMQSGYAEAMRLIGENAMSAEGHRLMGQIYWDVADYKKAQDALHMALYGDDSSLQTRMLLAKTYARNGKTPEAASLFEEMLSLPVPPTTALLAAGDFFVDTLQLDRAVEIYGKLVRRHPDDLALQQALFALEQNLIIWNRYHKREAAEDSGGLEILVGNLYRSLGKNQEAISHYESVLRQRPQDLSVLSNLADLYRQGGYPLRSKAINAYEKILEHDPDNATASLRLGQIFFRDVRDYESALHYFGKAVALNPEIPEMSSLRRLTAYLADYLAPYKKQR